MDFGDILNQWEGSKPGDKDSADLEAMLDKYDRPDPGKDEQERPTHPGEYRKKVLAMEPEAELDLHGFTKEDALGALNAFINESLRQRLKKVLIIHGKGHHSAQEPILARTVREAVEKHPSCGEFGYAKGNEGGKGAVWVILRYRSR